MKVYRSNVEAPKYDYANMRSSMEEVDAAYIEEVKQNLLKTGWTGPNTGRIIYFGVADGYAQYMFAENAQGKKAFLVHLEVGDAYHYHDVRYLPVKEVLNRIEQSDRMRALFAKR